MLKVEKLNKHFISGVIKRHRTDAVKEVSFEIPEGKILGLAGNSGCGKSTVARLLMRLIQPDSGQVFLDGEEIGSCVLVTKAGARSRDFKWCAEEVAKRLFL